MALAPPSSAGEPTGGAASGATDDGSAPLKVGGVYHATAPTLVDGQREELTLQSRGGVLVAIQGAGSSSIVQAGSANDGTSAGNAYMFALGVGMLYNGSTLDRQRVPSVFKWLNATAIAAETTIWTPAAGKKFRLMGFLFSLNAATSIVLRDNTAGTVLLTLDVVANTPFSLPANFGNGYLSAVANNVLTAQSGAAANLRGVAFGTEE